jgi:hypothetical protein
VLRALLDVCLVSFWQRLAMLATFSSGTSRRELGSGGVGHDTMGMHTHAIQGDGSVSCSWLGLALLAALCFTVLRELAVLCLFSKQAALPAHMV